MLVFGIESTCDETSCAIVKDGFEILSHTISSQIAKHREFGGVVPELASRLHIETIFPIVEQTLQQAGCTFKDIDLFAVAKGPGLIGALLVGLTYAKGLAWATGKPLVGVNHIEAHLFASMMKCPQESLRFPSLGVVLSGGHTSLILIHKIGHYTLLSETIDDAIGEAFDKVAKILDLPYPGGPEIEKLALGTTHSETLFRPSRVKEKPLHFSFSGIKTSVLYAVKGANLKRETALSQKEKAEIAASFQYTVFKDVVEKIKRAIEDYPVEAIFLGGGVTRNSFLRTLLQQEVSLPTFFPENELCLDNAAMIAGLGYFKYLESPTDALLTLNPETRIPF